MAKAPAYVEAYPVLSAADAVRRVRGGQSRCLWRNRDSEVVGDATVVMSSPDCLQLRHSSFELDHLKHTDGEAEFKVIYLPLKANQRALFVCSKCNGNVSKIVLTQRGWACQACSSLCYKAEVGRSVFDYHEIDARVSEHVFGGRSPGMWNKQYAALLERQRDIKRHLQEMPLVFTEQLEVLGPEWLGPEGDIIASEEAEPKVERPGYWEAYPLFSVIEGRKAFRRGEGLCLWSDKRGRMIGGAEIESLDRQQLRLRYAVQRTATQDGGSGQISFECTSLGSTQDNKRLLVICPSCQHARSFLGLVQRDWACRECHGLEYRSALIGTRVRQAEKLARLSQEIKDLRQAGRSGRILKNKLDSAKSLRAKLGAAPHPVANRSFSHVLTHEWCRSPFSVDGFYDVPLGYGAQAARCEAGLAQDPEHGSITAAAGHHHIATGFWPAHVAASPESTGGASDVKRLGEYLFSGGPLKTLLWKRLRERAEEVLKWDESRPSGASDEELAAKIAEDTRFAPLKLSGNASSPSVFESCDEYGKKYKKKDEEDEFVDLVASFRFKGDELLWYYHPEGHDLDELLGEVNDRKLDIGVRVPLKDIETSHREIKLIRMEIGDVVDAQRAEVEAFNAQREGEALKLVKARRARQRRLAAAEREIGRIRVR